jgi:hypothetical protein
VEWRRSELPLELEVGGKGGHSAQAGKGEMEWGCRLHVTQRLRERGGGVQTARGARWGRVLVRAAEVTSERHRIGTTGVSGVRHREEKGTLTGGPGCI